MSLIENLKPSKSLAVFQLNFTKGSLKAYVDDNGILRIGINHANQDRFPFSLESIWTQDQAIRAWYDDITWQTQIVNKWLSRDLSQYQFDMLVDLMCDDIMMKGARPVTLFHLVNMGNFELASEQFLRWIVNEDDVSSLARIRRAFARRAYFRGFEWRHYAKCPINYGDYIPLNDILSFEGYRVVPNHKVGFIIERIA